MALNSFGLPSSDDENLNAFCSRKQIQILSELRAVCKEVGSLSEAKKMSTDIRKWWLGQIEKENEDNK